MTNVVRDLPYAPAWLTVDLGAVARNYDIFRTLAAPGCAVAGIVKADGYGLGVARILAALERQDCPFYFVATVDEAISIRELTRKPVAVLGGLYHGAEDFYLRSDLIPVLNSLEDIARWRDLARRRDIALPAILHIDTGMNRLGLDAAETEALHRDPALLNGLNILYIMSHFACADEDNHEMTSEQQRRFAAACAPFPRIKKSLANSSGAFRNPAFHHNLLRPGMALYGLNPTPERTNPMRPVVTLSARILQVRAAGRGESVGYGATYRCETESHIATIALGYADGFLRSLSSRPDGAAFVYYNNTACPIIGRISMDLVTIAAGHLSPLPRPGDQVEIIGPNQSADMLAAAAGSIGYEILTGLGRRYHRTYTG